MTRKVVKMTKIQVMYRRQQKKRPTKEKKQKKQKKGKGREEYECRW